MCVAAQRSCGGQRRVLEMNGTVRQRVIATSDWAGKAQSDKTPVHLHRFVLTHRAGSSPAAADMLYCRWTAARSRTEHLPVGRRTDPALDLQTQHPSRRTPRTGSRAAAIPVLGCVARFTALVAPGAALVANSSHSRCKHLACTDFCHRNRAMTLKKWAMALLPLRQHRWPACCSAACRATVAARASPRPQSTST